MKSEKSFAVTNRSGRRSVQPYGLALLFLMVAAMTSCMSAVNLEGGRVWPRNPMFTIKPQNYSEQELAHYGLRTDGVYVDIGLHPPEVNFPPGLGFRPSVPGTNFLRFWPNGRMMHKSSGKSVMTAGNVAAADSFEYAIIGYYEFDGDGRLMHENYYSYGGKWRYGTRVYEIEDNELWDCVPPSRGRSMHGDIRSQRGYRFVQIEGMTAEPDW